MTECADSTMLRTHLDQPEAALDAHLDECESCTGLLHSVAEDTGFVAGKLALLDPGGTDGLDIDAALAAVVARSEPTAVAAANPDLDQRSRWGRSSGRRLALAAAAALVFFGVAVTPPGRSAIAATLDAFRGDRLQAVTVDLGSWATAPVYEGLRALDALGTVDAGDLDEPTEVADLAAAEELAGIRAPSLADPPDRVLALAPGTVRITLSADDGNGVPAELDGATLAVDVPGAIAAVHGDAGGLPELVVGRSGPLQVRAEGAPLADIRSFLLAREELPADLRRQLAAIDDWRSTIPVPVPLGAPGWEEVEVGGRKGIAFGDDSGFAALVLRHDPDGITVVGGRIPVSRALELAAEA